MSGEDQTTSSSMVSDSGKSNDSPTKPKIDYRSVNKWLQDDAHVLRSVDIDANYDDLQSLKTLLSNVQILGVGEPTHGTSEFFRFKSRLFDFLIREMGFRILALEADWYECEAINKYVLYGEGDVRSALCNLTYVHWQRQEMLEFIEHLRAYNQSLPKDQFENLCVKFYGLEKTEPKTPARGIKRFLTEHGQNTKAVDEILTLVAIDDENLVAVSQKKAISLIDGLSTTIKKLRQLTEEQREEALGHLSLLRDAAILQMSGSDGSNIRDRYMAESIETIRRLNGANTKIMVWSHNGHVSFPAVKSNEAHEGQWVPMGVHLKKHYGDRYYALAQYFLQGSFSALDADQDIPDGETDIAKWSEFWVEPEQGSLEWLCGNATIRNFYMDLRTAPDSVSSFIHAPHSVRECATWFSDAEKHDWLGTTILSNYDGFVFLRKTRAASSLTCR